MKTILSLLTALSTLTTALVAQEPSLPETQQPETTHLMGKWICNNDPADIYLINPDKTAQHFVDKGDWKVAENTLTISWGNGFRLTFDIAQKGPQIVGKSYPPGKTEPDGLTFKREKQDEPVSKASVTLPAERTLTSADGRQMPGTVMSMTDAGIKFRRASDGREVVIPLAKLSDDDRTWLESRRAISKPIPLESNGRSNRVDYGRQILLRIKKKTYALEINGLIKPDDEKAGKDRNEPKERTNYKISYKIHRINPEGVPELIKEDELDEVEYPALIRCNYFKIKWSARNHTSGHIYLIGNTDREQPNSSYGLPEESEYYSEQLATLDNLDEQIVPAKWVKVSE